MSTVAIVLGGFMRKLTYVLLMSIITACAAPPANLVGKSFDADSIHCRQLWKRATLLVQYDLDVHAAKARATNPILAISNPTNPIKLDGSRRAYEKDCETLSNYNLRK